ncbi:hypothetical protein SPHINGO391_410030 [Sphingomonas aurantiaca]|uniref:Uncharacterized protein n=1 Tax=Sphingomonas aurantiaca TaxID=185949 RepID=A0A5E7YX26_9SPHN|nr:hypothetical protein SPHINGO391_410030 [Sphingomonas aurantiaca]
MIGEGAPGTFPPFLVRAALSFLQH